MRKKEEKKFLLGVSEKLGEFEGGRAEGEKWPLKPLLSAVTLASLGEVDTKTSREA